MQTLLGFYNARQGSFDTFLFTDPDDSSITGQQIGIGDGSTKTFQLLRALGGFNDIIQAPNVVSTVYLTGAAPAVPGSTARQSGS
jgi:hypothetical protein